MRSDHPLFFFPLVTQQVAALKSSQKLGDSCPGNNSAGRRSFVPTGKNWRDTNCTCSTYINHSWPPDYRASPLSLSLSAQPGPILSTLQPRVSYTYVHARVRTSIRASHSVAELNRTVPNSRRSHRGELREPVLIIVPCRFGRVTRFHGVRIGVGGAGVTPSKTISINRRRAAPCDDAGKRVDRYRLDATDTFFQPVSLYQPSSRSLFSSVSCYDPSLW